MILLRIILLPFSLLYSFIIFLRNKFYDFGFFKSTKISKPVISVGNITTGGTGKTPFTILIAEYFLSKGKKVSIISRGYKRDSNDLIIIDKGNVKQTINQTGDEPALIYESLRKYQDKLTIAVGADRIKAAEHLIEKINPDVIILDDGFQHRRLKRDLDIVLIDTASFLKEKFNNTFTLPSGFLRENKSNLKRAGLIIQNNKSSDKEYLDELSKFGKGNMVIRYKTEYIIDNKNRILPNHKTDAIVFSGIADDTSFKEMVGLANINIAETVNFPDHHFYSDNDIKDLKNKFKEGMIFLTTEKDFVKIREFSEFVNEFPVYFLKMNCEVTQGKELLMKHLDKFI